ncbi:MAG: adenosylcobinamide-GDP ribazoletransferase [Massilia sp.]
MFSAIAHQLRLFFVALQFFTRLPIPRWVGFQPEWLQHASRYFPLVGVVVGALCGAVYLLAAFLLPGAVAALLATIAGIYLTGAFHEDGFADVCDGFGGGLTRERVLEIMRDSRVGAYGAIGIALMLALKWLVLAELPGRAVIAAFLLAHPLSRFAASTLIWKLDYVRFDSSKAKPLAQQMSGLEFGIAGLTALGMATLIGAAGFLPWAAIVCAVATSAVAVLWLSKKFVRRIGGYTGDCLGAVQQVAEVAIYLSVLACVQRGSWH